jgi:hypothetical protein
LGYYQGEDLSFEAGLANNPMYVEQSRYAKHLRAWLEHFPRERVLIVLQEEIALDPATQARRIYEFLGIASDHESNFARRRANESYLPRSRSRERFVRAAGAMTRKSGLGWLDRALRKSGVISALHHQNRVDIRKVVPGMTEESRHRLYDLLGQDPLELAVLMERESLPWKTWAHAAALGVAR